MLLSASVARQAANHLAHRDPVLAPIIARFGLCAVRPHQHYYQELVESIIGQQLSVTAAATITRRFRELFANSNAFPRPEAILALSVDQLRSAGLSRAKALYVQDLARHVVEGRVRFTHLNNLANEQIIQELTAVKGIGEWTAHMFLLFCMGRSDILAYGDLGVRSGIQKLYRLDQLPSPQEVIHIATAGQWHPYESVACWYLWRSLDNTPVGISP